MKIVRLTAENFKRLVAVEIKPDGNTVLITGRNGAGKSSVLDAIVAALCGKKYHPDKPIRDGEDHAEIVIETENWIVKRTFTAAGGGSVTITNADGMKAQSPQALLDKIVGQIAFDPMVFITDYDARQQREVLMKLAGLDFSDIDADIAKVQQDRSDVRRDKDRLEGDAQRISVAADTPDDEVSALDLTKKLSVAMEHNSTQDTLRDQLSGITDQIEHYGLLIQTQDKEIERLEGLIAEATKERNRRAKLQKDLLSQQEMKKEQLGEKIVVEPIQQEISNIEATNTAVRNKKEKAKLLKESQAKSAEYSALLAKMKDLEQQKATRLAGAKMPLPGLSVTEDCVVYEGIPLSQVNDAKKLEIGMGIAMAENPELRVIRMKGNDLDDQSLEIVSKMAQEKDYQLWIERWSGGEGGIVIEEGSVKQDTLFEP